MKWQFELYLGFKIIVKYVFFILIKLKSKRIFILYKLFCCEYYFKFIEI